MSIDMLKVVPSELQFGTVAVNDTPVYSRFSVVNTDPTVSLSVQLTATTVPAAIRFKLWSDMALLHDDDMDGGDTPKDLQRGGTLSHYYNAVFDDTYIIDRIVLQPLETKSIVAIFHADPAQFPNVMMRAPPMMVSGTIHLTATSLPREAISVCGDTDKNDTNIEGSCVFAALSLSSFSFEGNSDKNPGNSRIGDTEEMKGNEGSNSHVTSNTMWRDKNPIPVFPSSGTTRSSLCAVRSETVTLPFSAGVYLSLLTVSKSELQTTMAPNKTHLMDFTVINASSLPLPFVIRTQTMPHKNVEFAVYEEDKFEEPKIGRTLLLDSYASMNFTLMVRAAAAAAGDTTTGMRYYRAVLQCDNLRDARNSELVYVRVNVVASESQRDLVSISNPVLDFGEVYRGTQVLRRLDFSTTSREDMTVRLLHPRPQHCEGALSLVRVSNANNCEDGNVTTSNNVGILPVDELVIAPPKGAVIVDIVYVPSTDQGRKGTSNLKFELELVFTGCGDDSGGSRRQQQVVVRCVATLFTSTIVASQKDINFGDCQVGQSRRCTFAIENPSPLPTTIYVQLRSKIISIEGVQPRTSATGGRQTMGEFSIAPRSSLPLTLRINPQRVNPTYHKQLTIVNVSNPAEDRLIVNIEANNMAPSEAKLHNELYTCESKLPCDDGNSNGNTGGGRGGHSGTDASSLRALTNVPLIVAYVLQSKVDYPLVLQLQCSSSEVETFCLEGIPATEFETLAAELRTCCCCGGGGEDVAQQLSIERAEEVRKSVTKALCQHAVAINSVTLEPRGSRTFYVNICRTTGGCDVVTKEDGVSIAVDGFEVPRFMRLSYRLCGTRFELVGQRTKNFGEVNIGERKTTKLPIVNQCNSLLLLRLSKSRSVTAGYIRMENSDKISVYSLIRPYATKELELSFYPGIKGSFEERIELTNVLDPSNEVTMTVKATITKAATFDVSPDTWSFGVVPVPMLVQQQQPLIQGTSNMYSSSGGGSNAAVSREEAGKLSVRVGARFTVVNTSTTRRALRLKLVAPSLVPNSDGYGCLGSSGNGVGSVSSNNNNTNTEGLANFADRFFKFDGVDVRLQLEMEHGGASSGSSRKLEEKIEKLEQKLRIYLRKNKTEKVESAMRQIDAFRRALMGEEVDLNAILPEDAGGGGNDDGGKGEQQEQDEHRQWNYNKTSEGEGKTLIVKQRSRPLQHPELLSLLLRDGMALPEMNAGESTIIILGLTCTRTTDSILPVQSGTITFLLYETKDKESNRVIPVDITLVRMEGEGDSLVTTSTTSTVARSLASGEKMSLTSSVAVLGGRTSGTSSCLAEDTPLLQSGADLTNTSVALPTNVESMALAPPSSSFAISVEPGDGVVASTFMRCPMALVVHCVAYESYKFSIFVTAACDTSVAVLNPIRFCSSANNGNINTTTSGVCMNSDGFDDHGSQSAVVYGAPLVSTSLTSYALSKSLDAQFNFFPCSGPVRENESLCIKVECTPIGFIPQRYFIPVKNLQHAFDVKYLVVEINPKVEEDLLHVSPKEIRLSDIIVPCDESCLEVQSFLVRSRFTIPHALIIRSNRPSLVSFFLDAKCTIPLVNPVKRTLTHEKLRIYFQFVPSERSWRHKSRVVMAGILVEAVVVDKRAERISYSVLAHASVRLAVCVGSGELLVRESFIDLEAVPPQCSFASTSITVVNPSDRFEVRARVTACLKLTVVETPELTLLPGAEMAVPVKLQLVAPGLVQESLSVRNLSCKQKPLTVGLSVLRHDEMISARVVNEDEQLSQSSHHGEDQHQCMDAGFGDGRAARAHSHHISRVGNAAGGGVVVFPTAAVIFCEDTMFRLHSPVTTAALHVTNHSTRDFILVAKSSTPLVLGLPQSLPLAEDASSSALPLHAYPRGRVRLDAHHTEAVAWTLVSMPPLTAEQKTRLLQHEVVTMETMAQVCVAQIIDEVVGFNYGAMFFSTKRALPAVGQCVLLPKFILTFAVSEGRADPPLIDLGVVGIAKGAAAKDSEAFTCNEEDPDQLPSSFSQWHAAPALSKSRWTDRSGGDGSSSTPVVIRLTNLSPILPLRLSVECEPTVRFTSNRIFVPPSQTVTVEAFLVLKLIRTQGPFCFAVYFVNELNPENDMLVHVTGQYYWKVFELSCDGVMDGERESLSMEALRVRETSVAADILSESKIVMTAMEPRVEVGVGVTGNPKLEGLIQLQVLQYDAAASLQKIVFGQLKHGSANVAAAVTANNNNNHANNNNNNNNRGGGIGLTATDCVIKVGTSLSGTASSAIFGVGSNTSLGITGSVSVGGGNSGGGALVTPLAANTSTSIPVSALTTTDSHVIAASSRQKEQKSFRLRCVLMNEDFAALSAAFYGHRKNKQADIIRERQAMTLDKITDVVERRRSRGSSTMWLGTIHFSNTLTGGDEEVQVFSTLSAFQTFNVPNRITLRPCAVPRAVTTASTTTVDVNSLRTTLGREVETGGMDYGVDNVYVGELLVLNPCLRHCVMLSVTPLKDRAYQDGVAVLCVPLDEETATLTQMEASGLSSASHGSTITWKNEFMATSSVISISNIAAMTAAGGLDVSETKTVFVSVSPQCVRRIQVVMRIDMGNHQLNVEQAVAFAVFDESVPCSAMVVRINLASLDELAQQQQQKQQELFLKSPISRAEVSGSGSANGTVADGGGACESVVENCMDVDKTTVTSTTITTASTMAATSKTGVGLALSGHTYAASPSPRRVLSLHGTCRAVTGCSGVYACSFSYTKDAPPATNITVCNNLSDVVVEYSVVILSQGPQPWLLLPSATAVLGPGEAQPLRLDILSTEAGSFNGYVSILNTAVPGEVLLLQLSAEVFVPTAGEGLFEIIASNGQRMVTNVERRVFAGRLFGEGTYRAHVALEIVNRAAVPLEFPVAVVKPFRMEFANAPDGEDDVGLTTTTAAAVTTVNKTTTSGVTSGTYNSNVYGNDNGLSSSRDTGATEDGGMKQQLQQHSGVCARPECDVRLLVCRSHNVSDMCGQKRFVVDPKSRVKVAFLFICDRLSLPSGIVVHGEAEVVLKCKQARDAKFVFKVRFDVCRPSVRVPRQIFFTPADDYTVNIPVTNLRCREIRVTFRTFSSVIEVLPEEETKGEGASGKDKDQPLPLQGESDINFIITGGNTTAIRVRLNVARLASLQSWNSPGDMVAALPTIYDHGLLLVTDNPSECVLVELCYQPPSPSATVDRISIAAAAAAHPIAKSLKYDYWQISEQRLFQFVQRFWRVLSEAAEVMLPEFRYYTEQRGIEAPDSMNETVIDVIGGGNGGGSTNNSDNANSSNTKNNNSSFAGTSVACWKALSFLLVDLTCLVEELLHKSVLLRNLRTIEAHSLFLAASVTSHPLMRAWRQHKPNLPTTRAFAIFGQYMEAFDALPCLTPFLD